MPSFTFRPNFVTSILTGTKTQTIRAKRRCKPGDSMHLFTGLRTKACQRLAVRPCVVVDYVHLAPDGIVLGDSTKHPRDVDEFARLDGLEDYPDMYGWFVREYGQRHFCGVVHRWASAPHTVAGV